MYRKESKKTYGRRPCPMKRLGQVLDSKQKRTILMGVTARTQDTDEGQRIVLSKGGKWFAVPVEDTDEGELFSLMSNFDKEWELRIGQNLE
ncbi:MAG: hypothetical protein ABSE15_00545 [Candidatus Bathyarchaeia archaeon]